jgi:hypothetical protein
MQHIKIGLCISAVIALLLVFLFWGRNKTPEPIYNGDRMCFGFINVEQLTESRQEMIAVRVNLRPKGDNRLLFELNKKRKINLQISLPDSMYSTSVCVYEFAAPLSVLDWNGGDFDRIASTKWESIAGEVNVNLTASQNIEEGKRVTLSLSNIVLKSEQGNHKKKINKIFFQNLKILDSRANYLEKIDKTEKDHILSTSEKRTE